MKLRNKLILSCAALAAVATTAVSTTYAWYTSNTEVHANGISATTKNAGSDLLMIADGLAYNSTSKAYEVIEDSKLVWGTTVNPTLNASDLTPLAYKLDPTKIAAKNTTDVELVDLAGYEVSAAVGTEGDDDYAPAVNGMQTGTTAATTGYTQFVLFVKNGGTEVKGLQMTIKNLTNVTKNTALPTKAILNPAANAQYMGLSTSTTTYTVNALRVAAIDLEVSTVTGGTAIALADEGAYSLKSANSTYDMGDTITGSYDAHAYYNAIMEADLKADDAYKVETSAFRSLGDSAGTKILVDLPAAATANNYLKLDFKIFLNGWDKACFDACQGQEFSFDIDFKTTTKNA